MFTSIYELPCMDSRKSFYGKAKVAEDVNGGRVLLSYDTPVARVDASGVFHRLWGGYSATTMRHVNSFARLLGVPGSGKSWWDSLTIEEA